MASGDSRNKHVEHESRVYRIVIRNRASFGSTSIGATNLNAETLPKVLMWTRREPEMHVDTRMMKRYGIGQVFELQPRERVRLLLPIYVPQAHPHDFVEHFVLGYRQPSLGDGKGAYDTYVAEVKR